HAPVAAIFRRRRIGFALGRGGRGTLRRRGAFGLSLRRLGPPLALEAVVALFLLLLRRRRGPRRGAFRGGAFGGGAFGCAWRTFETAIALRRIARDRSRRLGRRGLRSAIFGRVVFRAGIALARIA